jgi:hypothetical protein
MLNYYLWQYQAKAEPFPDISVPDYGWFVQGPDVVRAPTRPEGEIVAPLGDHEDLISDFSWFVQEPDVMRPRHQTSEGLFTRGRDNSELAPSFDWFVQHPEPLPRPTRPDGMFALVEFSVPIPPAIPDIDWNIQEPDVVRPRHQTDEGLFVRGRDNTELAPEFDWFVQEPDVMRAPTRPEGTFVRGLDNIEIAPDFGWFVQQADVIRSRHLVRPGLFVQDLLVITVVLDFSWFIQGPDVVRRPTRPHGFEARPLLILVAPVLDLVFEIRVCLQLDELEINRLLPNPSGFLAMRDNEPDASGYIKEDDGCGSLSGIDDDLPSPSGYKKPP